MKREIRDLWYSVVPRNRYLQTGWNNSNIILAAPHGGGMRPVSIPKRSHGKTKMDTYTRRLTKSLISRFEDKPNYVIADIHRSRVDLNRDYDECCEHPKAVEIWNDWNDTVEIFCRRVLRDFGDGLYVDIHSQAKTDTFHLGYSLSVDDYNRAKKRGSVSGSTIDSVENIELWDLMFGPYSIKSGLERFGFRAHEPKYESIYYNGGRNIETFSGNGLRAIQIECPISILREDREAVAFALRYSIDAFRERFLNVQRNP